MSNVWKTTISEDDYRLEGFSRSPDDPNSVILVRVITGLDRTEWETLETQQSLISYVSDPTIDGQTQSGTWQVKLHEFIPVNDGLDAGSLTYRQTLKYGTFGSCTDENAIAGRSVSEAYEQIENGWMYYEWQRYDEGKTWSNIQADLIDDVFGYMKAIQNIGSDSEFDALSYSNGNYYDVGGMVVYGTADCGVSFYAGALNTLLTRTGIRIHQETTGLSITSGKYYRLDVSRNGSKEIQGGIYPVYALT